MWIPPLYVGPIHFESIGVSANKKVSVSSAPLFVVTKQFVHVYSRNLTSICNEYISVYAAGSFMALQI